MAKAYRHFPLLGSDDDCTHEGDAILYKQGLAVLGNTSFNWTDDITDHRFSGCVANRGESGVLTIVNPVGATYRYLFVSKEENWYRLVEEESSDSLRRLWMAQLRESVRHYGLFFGVLHFGLRLIGKGARYYLIVMVLFVMLGQLLGIGLVVLVDRVNDVPEGGSVDELFLRRVTLGIPVMIVILWLVLSAKVARDEGALRACITTALYGPILCWPLAVSYAVLPPRYKAVVHVTTFDGLNKLPYALASHGQHLLHAVETNWHNNDR
ncbi:MAG: hypothetical protein U0795_23515 [Pirellulales bacterium]